MDSPTRADDPPKYHPTTSDVLQLKRLLASPPVSLPLDLVEPIIDLAEYWPHSSLDVVGIDIVASGEDRVYTRTPPLGAPGTEGECRPFWGSEHLFRGGYVLPEQGDSETEAGVGGMCPCRKVVWEIWAYELVEDIGPSQAQSASGTQLGIGMGGVGRRTQQAEDGNDGSSNGDVARPYANAKTWFDLTIERASTAPPPLVPVSGPQATPKPDRPPPTHLQRNLPSSTIGGPAHYHRITLHYLDAPPPGEHSADAQKLEMQGRGWRSADGKLVRGLRYGDRLVLWMHARGAGVFCFVQRVRVKVWWAV